MKMTNMSLDAFAETKIGTSKKKMPGGGSKKKKKGQVVESIQMGFQ